VFPLYNGVDLGLTKVHHILPLPESVDSPPSELFPLRFADFLLIRVFGFAVLVSQVRSLCTETAFLTLYIYGGWPKVWELFQEGLSPKFSVATRWHILLPLPPSKMIVALSSQTELETSCSKAKEMEKVWKEVRMQIPGVPPR
jgi:hypothetical protein